MNKAIVGSHSYGLNLPNSDIDVGIMPFSESSADRKIILGNRIDTHAQSLSTIITDMFGPNPRWFFTQYLFPESFLSDNNIVKYVLDNREGIMKARLPILFKTYMKHSRIHFKNKNKVAELLPKRTAYSTLFYSILANYAEGMPFAQAHRPEGELHDFLIGMRLGQVPLEDAVARNELERIRAEKAAGFYKESIHPEILREFEQVIREEAEKEGG